MENNQTETFSDRHPVLVISAWLLSIFAWIILYGERYSLPFPGFLFIFDIVLAFIPAIVAGFKGRTASNWWLYGFWLLPIALTHAIMLPRPGVERTQPSQPSSQAASSDFRVDGVYRSYPYQSASGGAINVLVGDRVLAFPSIELLTSFVDERERASRAG